MKEKLQRFMYGRYGADELSRFLIIMVAVCLVLNIFFSNLVFYVLSLGLLGFGYYRMFSKNHSKRYAENQKFLQLKNKFFGFFKGQKSMAVQRKTHHIYKCPNCRQKIRIPRGKGKIAITCPSCRTEFEKKS